MDDGMLSQEEIDALLQISDDDDDDNSPQAEKEEELESVSDYLTSIEEDTIGEIGNISFGTSATTLSTLLNQKVEITTPEVSIVKKSALREAFPFEHVSVQVSYEGGFTGENVFVIKSEDAAIISDIMLGGDGTNPDKELNDIHLSAVQEAMNQMMGSAATSMSTIFDKLVNITPPKIELVKDSEEEKEFETDIEEEVFVKVSFQLKVGNLIDSNIMQIIPFPFANELVAELLSINTGEAASSETDSEIEEAAATVEQLETPAQVSQPSQQVNQQAASSSTDQASQRPQHIGSSVNESTATVQPASFSEFEPVQLRQHEQQNLDMLLDIPLKVTVELGRTNRPIKDILDLSAGSIIELDKLAGEPVDVLVNDKLIAKGEVVVIDENFGVRVTDIISQSERLMKLN